MASFCVTCTVPQYCSDEVVGICYALGLEGCHEEESLNGVRLHLYFEQNASPGSVEHALFKYPLRSAISIETVVDEDWNSAWRSTIEPVRIAPGYWASPRWLDPPLEKGDRWLKIEPKMAFGTGHHETTRLAAQALMRSIDNGETVESILDIGTGSGILCLCAADKGVGRSVGVELDPDCRENLAENRRDNDKEHHTQFSIGTLDCIKDEDIFDLAAMNMIYTESRPCLFAVHRLLKPKGRLIWSGILVDDKHEAVIAGKQEHLSLREEAVENEWWCGVFEKD